MSWKDLSIREKAAYIHTGVRNGLTDLKDIENAYNSFEAGGKKNNKKITVHSSPERGTKNGYMMFLPAEDNKDVAYTRDLPGVLVTPRGNSIEESTPVVVPSLGMERILPEKAPMLDISQINNTQNVQIPYAPRKLFGYKELELDGSSLRNNKYLTSKDFDRDTVNVLKSFTPEEVREIQREMANNGEYDIDADNLSEAEIKNIQTKLYNKGLLKGRKEDAVDGVFGNKTREAWREYNIDGVVGNRTIKAFQKSIDPKQQWKKDVPTANTEWCAEWVHKKVDSAAGTGYGVHGNAWNMLQNVVDEGGEMIYNIYNQRQFKGIESVHELKKKTENALRDSNIDLKKLKVGDIVGIYMPSSNMHEEALKTGDTFNTHVGVVTGFDEKGMPIVEHNIHRVHHSDPANHITGSRTGHAQITAVARPNYSTGIKEITTKDRESQYTGKEDSELFHGFANSIAGSKDTIKKIFPSVDIDTVEQIALAVQGRETGFMKNRKSDATGATKIKNNVEEFYRDKIKRVKKEDVSSDLAKMKYSSLSPDERNLLGIVTPESLNDPKLAGRAALYLLSRNYDYFKRLQHTYPDLGITNRDLTYLTELSYNQGMGKLKNIGFDQEGNIKPSELQEIRRLANPNNRVKDVTSTNWKHLGLVGDAIYGIFGKESIPYIGAAEDYRSRLIKRSQKKNNK